MRVVRVVGLHDRWGEIRRRVNVLLSDEFLVSELLWGSRRLFNLLFVAVYRLLVLLVLLLIEFSTIMLLFPIEGCDSIVFDVPFRIEYLL